MLGGQSKINSFFTKSATKRKAEDQSNASNSPPKKSVKEATSSDDSSSDDGKKPLGLSPEQKARMEQKKAEAQEKLLAKSGPQNFGLSWKKALAEEFKRDYFVKLSKFVEQERAKKTVYPPEEEVFSFTLYTDIKDTKVVIIGQDPYHGPRQAHGLCFSVQPGVSTPPSLINIYKELANDIEEFKPPGHGYLVGWAKQGVLLLNACLTVVASQANSHKDKGWEQFTDAVIRWINKNLNGVVFLLWGAYAQKKGSFIDKKKHCVLKAVHPSPLSAHRGFMGCKHFSQTNEYLVKVGKRPIKWDDLPVDG